MQTFSPAGDSATISATTSSSRVALGNANHPHVRISNISLTIPVYLAIGGSSVAAAVATGFVVLPGESLVVERNPQSHTHLAGITGSDSAGVVVTTGSAK